MGYLYAFLVALLYSTTGLLSKTAGGTLHPVLITLGRFVFGAGCMALLLLAQKKRIRLHFLCAPILGGSACKTLNFLTENGGVSLGYSYGNMVIWPMQTVFTLLFSLFLLREKASARQWLGTGMCILGVAVIAWNGRPVSGMLGERIGATALFVLSGFFSAAFTLFQKKLMDRFDAVEMNLSVFTVAAAMTLLPALLWGGTSDPASPAGVLAVVTLGITACAGNLLVVWSIKKLPLFLFSVIQSSSVLLSLLWAWLLRGEPVSRYTMAGTAAFLTGMLLCIRRQPAIKR